MERLAFIRLLFGQAVSQAALPAPLDVSSVLTLHDAAELFLVLAGERLGASLPRYMPFMEYWKALGPGKLANGVRLPAEQQMSRLNDLRNSLKHHGTLPSKASVDQACADVRTFFEASTLAVFGIEFAAIDMAEVIPQPEVKAKVRAASAAAAAGDTADAMGELAEAFEIVTGDRPGPRPRQEFGRFGPTIRPRLSAPEVGAVLRKPDDLRGPTAGTRRLAKEIADVALATQEMQTALRMMVIGVDYRQFDRFKRLTPNIAHYIGGRSERHSAPDYAPDNAEFEDCRQFIIAVALRMAELEPHIQPPSWKSP
jgi:hypothetical protein